MIGRASGRSAPAARCSTKPAMTRNKKPMPAMVMRLVSVVQKMPRFTPATPLSDRKYFFWNEANI